MLSRSTATDYNQRETEMEERTADRELDDVLNERIKSNRKKTQMCIQHRVCAVMRVMHRVDYERIDSNQGTNIIFCDNQRLRT